MCGRYYLSPIGSAEEYIDEASERLFKLGLSSSYAISTGEIFPSNIIPVIANSRKMTPSTYPMRWGYALQHKQPPLLINARSETAAVKPLFKDSWHTRRCLIPADHYFEWQREAGSKKQKYAIKPDHDGMIYLAGLYHYESDEKIPKCVILTRDPSPEIRFIHDRMPVIFSENDKSAWLDPGADPNSILNYAQQNMRFSAQQ